MILEQQVCSLDLAKRLKELGVRQESLFWWGYQGDCTMLRIDKESFPEKDNGGLVPCSAFTVAELGEMLPNMTWMQKIRQFSTDEKETWVIQYSHKNEGNNVTAYLNIGEVLGDAKKYYRKIGLRDGTETNARAHMLIYLIENKLLYEPISNSISQRDASTNKRRTHKRKNQ